MPGINAFEYFSKLVSTVNISLEEFCREEGHRFLMEMYDAVEDPDRKYGLLPELTGDGAHFNYRGYEVLGNAACAALDGTVGSGDRVLLIGDSITAGYPEYEPVLLGENYGDEKHSFGHYLRTALGCEIINRGISGDFTSSMVLRLDEYLDPSCTWTPDLVVLQGGANDAFNSAEYGFRNLGEERAVEAANEIFENFAAMAAKCGERKIPVAMVPLLPFFGGRATQSDGGGI